MTRVLVTGATGALGGEIARELSRRGARLALHGRDRARLEALAAEIGAESATTADLTGAGEPERVVAEAAAALGGLDAAVCAVGVVAFGPAQALDDAMLTTLMEVNLQVPVRLTRALAARMERGAVIVNISAIVAEMPTAGMAAYSASKAALTAFDRAGGRELRREGIRLIDVRPAAPRHRPGDPADRRRAAAPSDRPGPGRLGPEDRRRDRGSGQHRGRLRGVIKYIGSKRAVVPMLEGLARRLPISSVCDLFAGTTRVGQAFRRAGCRVVSNDLASYSEAFGQRLHRRRRASRPRPPARPDRPSAGAARRARLRHRDLLPAGALLLAGQRRPDRRDPRRDRPPRPRPGGPRVPAHEPDRGGRPRRLDLRPPDGLPEAARAAQPAAPDACASPSRSPGPRGR